MGKIIPGDFSENVSNDSESIPKFDLKKYKKIHKKGELESPTFL